MKTVVSAFAREGVFFTSRRFYKTFQTKQHDESRLLQYKYDVAEPFSQQCSVMSGYQYCFNGTLPVMC